MCLNTRMLIGSYLIGNLSTILKARSTLFFTVLPNKENPVCEGKIFLKTTALLSIVRPTWHSLRMFGLQHWNKWEYLLFYIKPRRRHLNGKKTWGQKRRPLFWGLEVVL